MFGVHLSLRVYFLYRRQFVQKFEFWFCDSEVFIVLILIYFSVLIHVKTSATWGGGRSPPHQSRTAYYLQKKMFNLNPKAYTQGPRYYLVYELKLHPMNVIIYKCYVISCYNAGEKGIKRNIT
jgi:hypothetical protein